VAKEAAEINALLSTELIKVTATDGGRRKSYRHRANEGFWELSHPQNETRGGGPRRLREQSLTVPEAGGEPLRRQST